MLRRSSLLFVIFCLLSVHVFAKNIFIETVNGISVENSDALTVTELIKTSFVEDLGGSLVNNSDEADFIVAGRLVKLGDAYSLTLIKSKNGSEVFRSSLKSSQMSDMDVVVRRLTRALYEEEAASENSTVKDVTLDEVTNGRRRKEVISQFSFGVGPGKTSNMNISGGTILWNVGYNYEVDYNWDMHLDVDWLSTLKGSEDDAYFYALNFGVNYYLTSKNASPFIDAHFGYGAASSSTGCSGSSLICSSKDKADGWIFGGGIGYRFFRTSESNFSFVFRGSVLSEETQVSQKRPMIGSLMIVGYFH